MGRKKGSRNINSKLEAQVLAVKAINPDWSAGKVRQYLLHSINGILPKKRSIQKILAEGKHRLDALQKKGLDKFWHLGTLKDYPLPAEAVYSILKINKWAKNQRLKPVTIRQAQWIARLCGVIENSAFLWKASFTYASYEVIYELSNNTDFDTSYLDDGLLQGNRGFTLRIIDNPEIRNAVAATILQTRGFGTIKQSKFFLDFLKARGKEGEK